MRVVYINKIAMDSTLPAVNFSLFNAYGLALGGATTWLIVQKSDPAYSEDDVYAGYPPEWASRISVSCSS